jgi:hypothetical protein
MSNFAIEKSPKREELNKGNNFENQYDNLARNPLGYTKVHNEIIAEMSNEGMIKYPNLTPTIGSGNQRQNYGRVFEGCSN